MPLLSRRIHVFASGGGAYVKATWPFGRIELDAAGMTLDAGFVSYRFSYAEIDALRCGWFSILVEHHAPNILRHVSIAGWGLKQALRTAVAEHRLPLTMLP